MGSASVRVQDAGSLTRRGDRDLERQENLSSLELGAPVYHPITERELRIANGPVGMKTRIESTR